MSRIILITNPADDKLVQYLDAWSKFINKTVKQQKDTIIFELREGCTNKEELKRKGDKLPVFLKRYFWDVEFSDLTKEKYPRFVLERVLEYGDEKAVKWMKDNFTEKKIKEVVCKSRNISKKSANFWQLLFNLKKNDVLCLTKSFQKKQGAIWNY